MAKKIIEITLPDIPDGIEVDSRYSHLVCLIRYETKPIAQVEVPLHHGKVGSAALRSSIQLALGQATAAGALYDPFAEHLNEPRLSATVAICTRERPDDLEKCLTALGNLADEPDEVLVIDNNPSTDATRKCTERFGFARYVLEPLQGLDYARNRALAEANSEIVAFIDDDAVADPHWLAHLSVPFRNPVVAAVTGLTMPIELESDAQIEFEDLTGFSQRGFVTRTFHAPQTHPLSVGHIGAGANMAIRKSIVRRVGPFDPALDAGMPSQSGGDHEYFSRLLKAGTHITYTPAALNWHRHRRTRQELKDTVHGYGVGTYAAWTRSLIEDGDLSVFKAAFGWFVWDQAPGLLKSILRYQDAWPIDLAWAQMSGCFRGPFAYFKSRKTVARNGQIGA